MRNPHFEFHDPNMNGSKDGGMFIQSVMEGQMGSQTIIPPPYILNVGGGGGKMNYKWGHFWDFN